LYLIVLRPQCSCFLPAATCRLFLQPGDTVRIHYRSTPYKEKWVICRQGTQAQPITFTGVLGPNGELPVIEGIGATTAPGLNYWSESRGVVKIGGANTPPDTMPKYIVIENLEIRGARASYTFTDDVGATVAYSSNASTIYVEKCEHCTIRNNILHDSGNGFFVASSDAAVSRDIVVERNRIYDNGNVGSIYEHNVYTAAIGIRFEANYLGTLRAGAGGNNLKDRSAGLVVRYNWIEGGNRQLDLVDGEDSATIRSDPGYSTTYVYGNILIENANDGNRQITTAATAATQPGIARAHCTSITTRWSPNGPIGPRSFAHQRTRKQSMPATTSFIQRRQDQLCRWPMCPGSSI
jgi:parallel beta-helix repeat protein